MLFLCITRGNAESIVASAMQILRKTSLRYPSNLLLIVIGFFNPYFIHKASASAGMSQRFES